MGDLVLLRNSSPAQYMGTNVRVLAPTAGAQAVHTIVDAGGDYHPVLRIDIRHLLNTHTGLLEHIMFQFSSICIWFSSVSLCILSSWIYAALSSRT